MTNEQILSKAIEKAVSNGMKWLHFFRNKMWIKGTIDDVAKILIDEKIYYQFIFSHDFAKPFWGEDDFEMCGGCGIKLEKKEITHWGKCKKCDSDSEYYITWQFHLQQMVLEKEPLKYIEKFI